MWWWRLTCAGGAHQRLAWETDDEASAARGLGCRLVREKEVLKQKNDKTMVAVGIGVGLWNF